MNLFNDTCFLSPFPKDIWKMFFIYFENNFCSDTLNSLSLTCKKLYNINKERKAEHIRDLKKYRKIDISFIKHLSMIMSL